NPFARRGADREESAVPAEGARARGQALRRIAQRSAPFARRPAPERRQLFDDRPGRDTRLFYIELIQPLVRGGVRSGAAPMAYRADSCCGKQRRLILVKIFSSNRIRKIPAELPPRRDHSSSEEQLYDLLPALALLNWRRRRRRWRRSRASLIRRNH